MMMRRIDREVTTPDVLWRMVEEGLVMHLALLLKLEKVVNVFALEISGMTGKIKGYPNPDKPDAKVVKEWES